LSENRALRRIFGPKRDELAGSYRKLHNDELNNLHASSSMIRVVKPRMMKWAGHVARMGEMRNAYNISVEKSEGKRAVGRPRCRWKDNIRIYLRKIGWEYVDWMRQACLLTYFLTSLLRSHWNTGPQLYNC
jgi:hypothetical protein